MPMPDLITDQSNSLATCQTEEDTELLVLYSTLPPCVI